MHFPLSLPPFFRLSWFLETVKCSLLYTIQLVYLDKFPVIDCVVLKNIHTPHGGHFCFRPPNPLEFP